jgi:hypothetical protein
VERRLNERSQYWSVYSVYSVLISIFSIQGSRFQVPRSSPLYFQLSPVACSIGLQPDCPLYPEVVAASKKLCNL